MSASGPGLFTTVRVRQGVVWLWGDHLRRLRAGAQVLGLRMPDPERLSEEVLGAAAGLEDARARITLDPGGAYRIEAKAYFPPDRPWRLKPVAASPGEDSVTLKTTRRMRYDAARRAAAGYDDALLLGARGHYLECGVANIFFELRDGRLLTPPADGTILPGLARRRVLQAARAAGMRADEGFCDPEQARQAVGCAVTNALFLAHPVASIEGAARFRETGLARRLFSLIARTAAEIRIIR